MPLRGRHRVRRTRQRCPQQLHRLEPFLKTHLLYVSGLNHAQRLPRRIERRKLPPQAGGLQARQTFERPDAPTESLPAPTQRLSRPGSGHETAPFLAAKADFALSPHLLQAVRLHWAWYSFSFVSLAIPARCTTHMGAPPYPLHAPSMPPRLTVAEWARWRPCVEYYG